MTTCKHVWVYERVIASLLLGERIFLFKFFLHATFKIYCPSKFLIQQTSCCKLDWEHSKFLEYPSFRYFWMSHAGVMRSSTLNHLLLGSLTIILCDLDEQDSNWERPKWKHEHGKATYIYNIYLWDFCMFGTWSLESPLKHQSYDRLSLTFITNFLSYYPSYNLMLHF